MTMENLPLVSVAIVAYNASATIIEALDSVYQQTYPNLELVIADDCSTDNTVALCEAWIAQYKERFVDVKLIAAKENKGIAGNYNRAIDVCDGEWVKEFDGDDTILPNAIEEFMNYVQKHPEAMYVFSQQEMFGASEARIAEINKRFDYGFFDLTIEEQLNRLLLEGNCVPYATSFYNLPYVRSLGFRYDERLPMLEDWPKWVFMLRKGVRFHYLKKVLVRYRAGGVSTGIGPISARYYKSNRLMFYYYQLPAMLQVDEDKAVAEAVRRDMETYEHLLSLHHQLYQMSNSKAYRLGKAIMQPLTWLRLKCKK